MSANRVTNKLARRRRGASERLFIGVYPTGIVYADRSREKHGDYARCGFLPFSTLVLELKSDCPKALRALIEKDAARLQARRGEQYQVSASGQTITLGHGR